jgi:hypothetical protein
MISAGKALVGAAAANLRHPVFMDGRDKPGHDDQLGCD